MSGYPEKGDVNILKWAGLTSVRTAKAATPDTGILGALRVSSSMLSICRTHSIEAYIAPWGIKYRADTI